jgi:cytochrome b
MQKIKVWDPVVRLFHWSLVVAFAANAFYTKPGRDLHQWVGYVVAGLIALRLVWGLVGTRHARFADFLPSPRAALGQLRDMATGRRRIHAGHSPLGALMIYNLLLTMAGLAATGYAMTTVAFFGVEWVEELHEALVVWAEVSIVAHVLAVVVESRRLGINLPKSMVTGYKTLP